MRYTTTWCPIVVYILLLLFGVFGFPFLLFSDAPIETDYAFFLFDHGDKNMVASMLKVAEEKDKATLDHLEFRIIFMGASVEAMHQEPFSHFSDKLLHYSQLGIEEKVDHSWKREGKLSEKSLNALVHTIMIHKKVCVPVSCALFGQIAKTYKDKTLAFRDNPSPVGDTDYFIVAKEVQNAASQVAVTSKRVAEILDAHKKIYVVGHGPMEEWLAEAQNVDKKAIRSQLNLTSKRPIIVYAGMYGESYGASFAKFLEIAPSRACDVLIVPHPRFKGILEKRMCENFKGGAWILVGDCADEPSKRIRSIDALSIADIVVTADPTSTIVFQANALGKKVLLVNPVLAAVGQALCNQKLLRRVSNREEFLLNIREEFAEAQDVFALLGMPRGGGELLWRAFLDEIK